MNDAAWNDGDQNGAGHDVGDDEKAGCRQYHFALMSEGFEHLVHEAREADGMGSVMTCSSARNCSNVILRRMIG